MRSLPNIKATIEKELTLFPQNLSEQFGDDTVIRLDNEKKLLQKLLLITEQFIHEQTELEKHLASHV